MKLGIRRMCEQVFRNHSVYCLQSDCFIRILLALVYRIVFRKGLVSKMNHRKYVIEKEAEKEAEIIIREIDPIKKEYFLKGATFAAKYLLRQLEVHPMEDEAIEKYLDKARIKSIREAVQAMLSLEERGE